MWKRFFGTFLYPLAALIISTSCNFPSNPDRSQLETIHTTTTSIPGVIINTPAGTPVINTSRVLTICSLWEPNSLFLYGDNSRAARNIRQAIYDGPFDIRDYRYKAIILEQVPSLENNDVKIEPIEVETGNIIVDVNGNLTSLADGVGFLPSGCADSSCAQIFGGQDIVMMDQINVTFRLIPGLHWSDETPLSADDSLYSFEVARSLFPRARSEIISLTDSYTAIDGNTVQWKGLPGYRMADYSANFFSPLPRHAWGNIIAEDLLSADISSRTPLGWGPYIVNEWISGDSISFNRNPLYFQAAEGLPQFDQLIFRFLPDESQAIDALLAGDCDLIDDSGLLESQSARLFELQEAHEIDLQIIPGNSWEQLTFGINSLDLDSISPFRLKETRQAIAKCIDRQKLVDETSEVAESYILSSHPSFNNSLESHEYDVQSASTLLDSVGWLDDDDDISTPRTSLGIPGIADGTPLAFNLLVSNEEEQQETAQFIKDSLYTCGLQVDINSMPQQELFAPGPEGVIFGRKFQTALFNWSTTLQPPCYLFTTSEVPGPYPEYLKGWGGANASGFSNAGFDDACKKANRTFFESLEFNAAQQTAQAIFNEELPVIPLLFHGKMIAHRTDFCGIETDSSSFSSLSNLEEFDFEGGCDQ